MRCHFNVRSKTDMSRLNLPYPTARFLKQVQLHITNGNNQIISAILDVNISGCYLFYVYGSTVNRNIRRNCKWKPTARESENIVR